MKLEIKIGDNVRFYDVVRDSELCGDEQFYSTGTVIDRRITEKKYYSGIDMTLGGDDVVDIKLPDGRISKSHFTSGVTLKP